MIHIYYGYGKGKTCSAIGAGMRAHGAERQVLLVQFLKDNKSSELRALPFDVYRAPEQLPFNPDDSYQQWIDNAFDYIRNSNADIIILDEFLDVIDRFVSAPSAVNLIKELKGEVIITGHCKNDELFEMADYITYLKKEKHPYDLGIKAREGIEY